MKKLMKSDSVKTRFRGLLKNLEDGPDGWDEVFPMGTSQGSRRSSSAGLWAKGEGSSTSQSRGQARRPRRKRGRSCVATRASFFRCRTPSPDFRSAFPLTRLALFVTTTIAFERAPNLISSISLLPMPTEPQSGGHPRAWYQKFARPTVLVS